MNEQQQITDSLFSEWYHYAILALWLIILVFGIKYYALLENRFKVKRDFTSGTAYGKNLLIISFLIGLLMVIIFTFKPASMETPSENYWQFSKYFFYGIFILLLLYNAYISVQHYQQKSGILRLISLSLLMMVYFYSGMLGGMIIFAISVMIILIFALIKLKKILTIR